MRRTLDSKTSDPIPSKLRPYSKDTDDFNLFEMRFKSMWRLANWTGARALSELVQNLQTPRAERIVKSKDMSLWTADSLIDACHDRLCPNLSLSQVKTELYELEPNETETPEETMCRVEAIMNRAMQTPGNRAALNMLQRQTFIRLIAIHEPMFFYVNEKSRDHYEPYDALRVAKEYIRTHGHESSYFNKLVDRKLEKMGIEDKSNENSNSNNNNSSNSNANNKNSNHKNGKKESKPKEETETVDCYRQFLCRNAAASQLERNVRSNSNSTR